MKLCGIIAEFNPLTNGHKYLIEEAKRKTGLNVVCIMSGNVVQRGTLPLLDKYARASHTINAGAVAVLELPAVYTLSSANLFAEGAVKCLASLNMVSHLAFGVTLDNPSELESIAKLKVKESQTLKEKIKANIKDGNNYNVSLYKAFKSEYPLLNDVIERVFSSPNNILALEYLTAIYKFNLNITPVYIKRTDSGYSSLAPKKVKINSKYQYFAGATYVREQLILSKFNKIKKCVPSYTLDSLLNITNSKLEKRDERLNAIILSSLREKSPNELAKYNDYNEGLASLVNKQANVQGTMSSIVAEISSKSYRKSRINKLLIIPYLSITKQQFSMLNNMVLPLNVLAVRKENKSILTKIIKCSKAKIIVSKKDYDNLNEQEKQSLIINQKASDLLNVCLAKPYSKDLTIFV